MRRYQDHPDFDGDLARRIDANPPRPGKGFPALRDVRIPLEDLYGFEASWPGAHSARKEDAIRSRFGCPSIRYYQLLFAAADTAEALVLDPMLTHRIKDQRDARAAARASRTPTKGNL